MKNDLFDDIFEENPLLKKLESNIKNRKLPGLSMESKQRIIDSWKKAPVKKTNKIFRYFSIAAIILLCFFITKIAHINKLNKKVHKINKTEKRINSKQTYESFKWFVSFCNDQENLFEIKNYLEKNLLSEITKTIKIKDNTKKELDLEESVKEKWNDTFKKIDEFIYNYELYDLLNGNKHKG